MKILPQGTGVRSSQLLSGGVWPLPGNRVLLGDELVNKLLAEIMRSIDPQIGQAGHLDGGET